MMTWHMLRMAAIARHRLYWRYIEDAEPERWPAHMSLVRAVYGY